jgi:hypothetical protein
LFTSLRTRCSRTRSRAYLLGAGNASLFECSFSLCLSRACLGKLIAFSTKSGSKRRFSVPASFYYVLVTMTTGERFRLFSAFFRVFPMFVLSLSW